MTTVEYIAHCRLRLEQIESIFKQMEADGIPKTVSVWDVLREKHEFWTSRIEAVSQTDPGNLHSFAPGSICLN